MNAMTAEEALARLEGLLDEENTALRAMKAQRVGELAAEKELWFTHLVDSGAFTRSELKPRLRDLHTSMQRNTLLLTYARDLTRDALAAVGVLAPEGYGRRGHAAPSARKHLSLVG